MKLREITGEHLEFLQMAEDADIDPEVFYRNDGGN